MRIWAERAASAAGIVCALVFTLGRCAAAGGAPPSAGAAARADAAQPIDVATAPRERPNAPDASTDASSDAPAPRASSFRRRMELVDAGREPRRVLRRKLAARGSERLRVSSATRVLDQQSVLAELRIDAPLDVTAEPEEKDGQRWFAYRIGPLKITTHGDERLRARTDTGALADGTSIAGRALLDARGMVAQNRFEPPGSDDAPGAAFARSLLGVVVEVPNEPVGIGARWDILLEVSSAEVSVTERTRHEVLATGPNDFKLRVEQSESVTAPGAQKPKPGSVSTPSTGEWTQRLDRIYPTGRQSIEQPLEVGPGAVLHIVTELTIAERGSKR